MEIKNWESLSEDANLREARAVPTSAVPGGRELAVRQCAIAVILVGTLLIALHTLPEAKLAGEAWGQIASTRAASLHGVASRAPNGRGELVARLAAHDAERDALQAQLDTFDAINAAGKEIQVITACMRVLCFTSSK
jgi:hypothetical protein